MQSLVWVLANLLLLWGFAIIKLIGNLIRSRRFGKGDTGIPGGERSAYYRDVTEIIYLRRELVFPGRLLRLCGLISLLPLLCSPLVWLGLQAPSLPLLPAIATLLLLEWGWYLQGLRPEGDGEGMLSGGLAIGTVEADYRFLWEEYQQIWPERVLAVAELKGQSLPGLTEQVDDCLARQKTVILKGWTPSLFATQLFHVITKKLLEHGQVLVVVNREDESAAVVGVLRRSLSGSTKAPQLWKIIDGREAEDNIDGADILVTTLDKLIIPLTPLPEKVEAWLSKVNLVIVPEVEGLFKNIARFAAFCHQRADLSGPAPDFVVMSTDHFSLESHLRSSLPLAKTNPEFDLGLLRPESTHVIVWQLEKQPWFQQKLFPATTDRRYLGAESVLSLPAWRDGIASIALIGPDQLPWEEYLEEIDNHRSQLRNDWVKPDSLGDKPARERLHVPCSVWMEGIEENSCRIVRDSACNVSTALANNWGRASGSLLLHLVSPPYLLRDYLVDNIDFFSVSPLLPLTPHLANEKLVVALTLLERMTSAALPEERILHLLRRTDQDVEHVETGIAALFRELFELDLWALGAVSWEVRLVVTGSQVKEQRYYSLAKELRWNQAFLWMSPVQFVNKHGAHLGTVSSDHLYQTLMPGQVLAFYGKPYAWVDEDRAGRKVVFAHKTPEGELIYRPHLQIDFSGDCLPQAGEREEMTLLNGWKVRESLCETAFRVKTHGYQKFSPALHLRDDGDKYKGLDGEIPERSYRHGRIFRLQFDMNGKGYDQNRIGFTLAHLINEALPTLFPETHRFLHVSTPLPDDYFSNSCLEKIHPKINLPQKVDGLELYFIEDSHADMGLVAAIQRQWDKYIFELLYDYLSWLDESRQRTECDWKSPNPIIPESYLRYGLETTPAEVDLEGARKFLESLGCGRDGSLAATRRYFYLEQAAVAAAGKERHQCDFCQKAITSTELERLQDGRERCADCRETAVNSPEELKQIYLEARRFMVENIRAAITRDIKVEFVSAEELHALNREQFLPTSSFDPRAIGMARWQKGKCTILIENGQPSAMTLATLVHELTHVWQFDTLDFRRMEQETGKLLIEGLAMWAELTCLRSKNLAPVYCDSESRRKDIYGQGYREIARQYQQRGENPFLIILREYHRNATI